MRSTSSIDADTSPPGLNYFGYRNFGSLSNMERVTSSTPSLPTDRSAIGQLLVRLLREFRTALFDAVEGTEFADLRFAHNQIWGNVGIDGIRLTELANKANLSLAACSELVNELQSLGYLERQPDPA